MVRRTILPAVAAMTFTSLALTSGAGWAQSAEDPAQKLPQQIREKLAAQGYEDVKITPSSYVVSAKDKNGQRVMMLIGPNSMTVMKAPANPSTAQVPDADNEIIQQ